MRVLLKIIELSTLECCGYRDRLQCC